MINIEILKKLLKNRRFGQNIIITKNLMEKVPKEFEETILGDANGAYKQYRCEPNIHILEYSDRYLVHKDRFDPRKFPLEHLIYDSPETLIAIGIGSLLGIKIGRKTFEIIKEILKYPNFWAGMFGFLTTLITGLGTYYILKELKSLLKIY